MLALIFDPEHVGSTVFRNAGELVTRPYGVSFRKSCSLNDSVVFCFCCVTCARTTADRYSSVHGLDGVGQFLISQAKGENGANGGGQDIKDDAEKRRLNKVL
jgi:hypothetical protein